MRKVRLYAGFFGRVYSLLSVETQENRKQILQQRQDQREHWEAEQVVLRAEQEAARQRREEQERLHEERRARAEAWATRNTRRYSRFIYVRLLQWFMGKRCMDCMYLTN